MSRRRLLILACASALLAGPAARAETTSYAFRATVTEVVSPAPLPEGYPSVGEPLTGRFRFDRDHPGRLTETRGLYRMRAPAAGIDLDLPSEPRLARGDLLIALSTDYRPSGANAAHVFQVHTEMRSDKLAWPFAVRSVRALLFLRDDRGRAVTSLALPGEIDLSAFTAAEVRVIGAWPRDGGEPTDPPTWYLVGRIEVLEPHAGPLEAAP